MTRQALLLISLCTVVAGCGAMTGKSDAQGLRDFRVVADLMPPEDLAGQTIFDDLTVPDPGDGGVADDLSANSGDGGANCVKVTTWSAVKTVGGYDSANGVSYVIESDGTNLPYNVLTVEDWETSGETHPKMVTYDSTVDYATCELCTMIGICTSSGCTDKFFAQAGTLTVTKADRNEATGRMTATASNLKLVEWDFSADQAVTNGACYLVTSATFDVMWSPPPTDAGTSPDLKGVTGDLKMPPSDMTTGPADMSTLACNPVINEVQAAGSTGTTAASDEFVEIYNPCTSSVNMSGWKLVYRSAGNNSGNVDTAAFTFTQTIGAGGYLIITGSGYTGAPASDGAISTGLAGGGGAVGLRNGGGVLVDSVAYDTLTLANNFTETAPAPNPSAGSSIARKPNGTDTNDNSLNFKLGTRTPRAAN